MKKILAIFLLLLSTFILTSCSNISEKKTDINSENKQSKREKFENRNQEENEVCVDKPVIYLYSEKKMDVSIKLKLNGKLTCTYPTYQNGWNIIVDKDGTIFDKRTKRKYNYLFWEGTKRNNFDFSHGFCVKGTNTRKFLENTLEKMGLNSREMDDFISFWLPKMEQNKYNLISFQNETYTTDAKLTTNPKTDTLIRVFMAWKPCEKHEIIAPQDIPTNKRHGFTVVEWGGSECQ